MLRATNLSRKAVSMPGKTLLTALPIWCRNEFGPWRKPEIIALIAGQTPQSSLKAVFAPVLLGGRRRFDGCGFSVALSDRGLI